MTSSWVIYTVIRTTVSYLNVVKFVLLLIAKFMGIHCPVLILHRPLSMLHDVTLYEVVGVKRVDLL